MLLVCLSRLARCPPKNASAQRLARRRLTSQASGAQRQFAKVFGKNKSFLSRMLAGRVSVTTPYGSLLVIDIVNGIPLVAYIIM